MKKARIFASRGQQKLIVFLIKIAQLQRIGCSGGAGVLLLDDFLTDFPTVTREQVIHLLEQLKNQALKESKAA